jgi:hypothetical protein
MDGVPDLWDARSRTTQPLAFSGRHVTPARLVCDEGRRREGKGRRMNVTKPHSPIQLLRIIRGYLGERLVRVGPVSGSAIEAPC